MFQKDLDSKSGFGSVSICLILFPDCILKNPIDLIKADSVCTWVEIANVAICTRGGKANVSICTPVYVVQHSQCGYLHQHGRDQFDSLDAHCEYKSAIGQLFEATAQPWEKEQLRRCNLHTKKGK